VVTSEAAQVVAVRIEGKVVAVSPLTESDIQQARLAYFDALLIDAKQREEAERKQLESGGVSS